MSDNESKVANTEVMDTSEATENTEVQDDVDPKALKAELDALKRAREEDTKRITDLKRQLKTQPPPQSSRTDAQVEYQAKVDAITAQESTGTFDSTAAARAKQQAYSDYQNKVKQIDFVTAYHNYSSDVEENVMSAIGDINSPEVKEVIAGMQAAIKQKQNLDAFVWKSLELVKGNIKTVDEKKLREELRRELHEELKKNPALKSDTSSSMGRSGARRITTEELAKMTPLEYAKAIKEGKIQI